MGVRIDQPGQHHSAVQVHHFRVRATSPEHLATAIAAALQYNPPADPAAQRLQQRLQTEGLPVVLNEVCGIDPEAELGEKVRARYPRVREQFGPEARVAGA